ncbi:MAG: hypothetical protein HN522_00560 [Flavobacteriales bacterium]|jgi:hypothetical protein|nr:hypothetical protein [Flavobacteriales bacterium]
MTNIINFLEQKSIAFAILKGTYDKESYSTEKEGFKNDLDIVLNCKKNEVFDFLIEDDNYRYLGDNSFLDIENNLRIDLYFKTLNVGYYHFLEIDNQDFLNTEVSELAYIIYQIIDPLLKFSKYHNRHQYRLKKYFNNSIPNEVEECLRKIIGKKLAYELLVNISNSNFNVKSTFIKKCKLNMLLINGNFVKMIKSRVF